MAKLDVYGYVINGVKYDIPFMECIQSVLPVADAIHIVTDPRFEDGTLEKLELIQDARIHIHPIQMDLNNPAVDGATKQIARARCTAPLLMQMDFDEVLRTEDHPKIKVLKDNWPKNIDIIGTGVINWFNGENVKLSAAGSVKERLSVGTKNIFHGIPMNLRVPISGSKYYYAQPESTDGAGLIDESGNPLVTQLYLAKGHDPLKDYNNPNSIWIHHYSWYSLPRKWEMKQTWHYFWGILFGRYTDLKSYKKDQDKETVDFWGQVVSKPHEAYFQPIRDEMNKREVVSAKAIKHPPIMQSWLNRQRVYVPRRIYPPRREVKRNMDTTPFSFESLANGLNS